MTGRTILIVFLSVVCGVAAAVYASTALNRRPDSTVETVPAVVAAVEIRQGVKITREMLRVKDVPRDSLPPGAIQRVEDVVDRAAEIPLLKEDFVLEGKLTRGQGTGLSVHIPSGMRAKAITMTSAASSVAGGIRPRDRVDVQCVVERFYPTDDSGGGIVTILQNVEVARVDNRLETAASEDGKVIEQREVKTVTLLVSPEQAKHLDLAEKQGKLTLHLRNAGDEDTVDSRPVTLRDLSFPAAPAKPSPEKERTVVVPTAPPPAPPQAPPIRLMRGTNEGVSQPQ